MTGERRGILYGIPVRLCDDDDSCEATNIVTGLLLEFFVGVCGFNGHVLEYEPGGYWGALWYWLTGSEDDE